MKKAVAGWAVFALLWVQQALAAPFSADTHDVYPGDFNGDGKSDLLVIAKDPNASSAIYLTDASGQPAALLQSWNSDYLGISWQESRYTAVIGYSATVPVPVSCCRPMLKVSSMGSASTSTTGARTAGVLAGTRRRGHRR